MIGTIFSRGVRRIRTKQLNGPAVHERRTTCRAQESPGHEPWAGRGAEVSDNAT